MKLLFYGGCINRQQGLAPHLHYHQLLKQQLQQGAGIETEIQLRFYTTYQELTQEAVQLPGGFDVLILFLRPYPLLPLTKPLIRYTDKQLQSTLTLHPKFNSTGYWQKAATETEVPTTKRRRTTVHRLIKAVNEKAGDLLNLDHWAVKYVLQLLQHYKNGLPTGTRLLIMGPPAYGANKRLNKICGELAPQVEQWCRTQACSYLPMQVLPNGSGKGYFAEDGIHISPEGHQQLAQELFKLLQP